MHYTNKKILTKDEFKALVEREYFHTEEDLEEMNIEIVPCNCASPYCDGWVLKHTRLNTLTEGA